jgi:uncharacterized protein (TIGR03000 family)
MGDSYSTPVYGTPSYGGGEIIGTPSSTTGAAVETVPADGAMLVVNLPADAQVFVNGAKTAATGSLRRYVSRGLEAGKDYEFVVKMVVDRDGTPSEQTKSVTLTAGNRSTVTFDTAVATPKTSLTLRVPADAKVWLAGNETASSGAVRLFETTTLKDGQAWKNYEIKVATVVDGKEQVVSKTIDLVAGKSVELALDPAQRTASADAQVSIR